MVSLNRSINGFWQIEERAYERRQFLYSSEVGNDKPLQLVGPGYRVSSNPMVFQMIPDLFIWVKFGGIRRKVKKL
jgi:hypothetical protein